MKKINLDLFVKCYLETASWVTCDSGDNTNFMKDAIAIAKADCLKFIAVVTDNFGEAKANELLTVAGTDLGYLAPHCFYLNRNRHGSGFLDRYEYSDTDGTILSNLAMSQGESNAYHIRGVKSKLIF